MARRKNKAYDEVIDEAERQGWRAKETSDGYQLLAPDGRNIVTIHLSESDHRAIRNTINRMRRFGFQWKNRRR